jgi:gamma-glutamylcysteine synthetase
MPTIKKKSNDLDPNINMILMDIVKRLINIESRLDVNEGNEKQKLERDYEQEGIRPTFASIRVDKSGKKLSNHIRLEIAKNNTMKYVKELDKLVTDFRTSYNLTISGLQQNIMAINSDLLEPERE